MCINPTTECGVGQIEETIGVCSRAAYGVGWIVPAAEVGWRVATYLLTVLYH